MIILRPVLIVDSGVTNVGVTPGEQLMVSPGRLKSREWTTWHGQKSRGGKRGSERSRA